MDAEPVWMPSPATVANAQITLYRDWLVRQRGLSFGDYDALWRWSVSELETFWQSLWDYFELHSATPVKAVLSSHQMPGARWFDGASVNYVDQVFRPATTARDAIIARNEAGVQTRLSWAELEAQVASLAAHLRRRGIGRGDRVVAYLPNIAPTVVAFLAVASIGAVWSLCSPDMGPQSVLDRFRQIEPKVLIACDGYQYGGRSFDRRAVLSELQAELPSLEHVILVPWLDAADCGSRSDNVLLWPDLIADDVALTVEKLPFDHPLWVVYSSGTTGLPKAIVHGHGGVLLESLKGTVLHNDLGPGDVFHWYSSTSWIMWNSQVAGLLAGATICLYDGNPGWPDLGALWRFVAEAGITFFGAGAAFHASCMKAMLEPAATVDLSRLRAIGSTGSPLSPETYQWIYRSVRADVWLCVIAGGTDFAGAFLAGNPTLPLYAGEMQCRSLGAAVYAFDEQGKAIIDQVGELVCTEPIPSMPLYFWNDPGNRRYHDSYFDMYPGVWRHGDWLRITPHGGGIIYGRSDATINRHGIRMGTSELYRAVEAQPEIQDSLVVDLEYLGRESYMPLFVVMRPGHQLSDTLAERLRDHIRRALSARHVPNDIIEIAEVPRTLSGKKLELPIKKILLGQAPERVLNRDALANPAALDWFVEFARRINADGTARGAGALTS